MAKVMSGTWRTPMRSRSSGADVGARGHEAGEGLLLLFEGAVDGDEDARGLAAGGEDDLGDMAGGDAGVRELSLEHGADLIGEGAGDTVAVVCSGSLLGHICLSMLTRQAD